MHLNSLVLQWINVMSLLTDNAVRFAKGLRYCIACLLSVSMGLSGATWISYFLLTYNVFVFLAIACLIFLIQIKKTSVDIGMHRDFGWSTLYRSYQYYQGLHCFQQFLVLLASALLLYVFHYYYLISMLAIAEQIKNIILLTSIGIPPVTTGLCLASIATIGSAYALCIKLLNAINTCHESPYFLEKKLKLRVYKWIYCKQEETIKCVLLNELSNEKKDIVIQYRWMGLASSILLILLVCYVFHSVLIQLAHLWLAHQHHPIMLDLLSHPWISYGVMAGLAISSSDGIFSLMRNICIFFEKSIATLTMSTSQEHQELFNHCNTLSHMRIILEAALLGFLQALTIQEQVAIPSYLLFPAAAVQTGVFATEAQQVLESMRYSYSL